MATILQKVRYRHLVSCRVSYLMLRDRNLSGCGGSCGPAKYITHSRTNPQTSREHSIRNLSRNLPSLHTRHTLGKVFDCLEDVRSLLRGTVTHLSNLFIPER